MICGVKVKQASKDKNDDWGLPQIQYFEKITASHQVLHYYWVQYKPINDTHAQIFLIHSGSDAKRQQSYNKPIGDKNKKVKPNNAIGPKLEVKHISKKAKIERDYDNAK